jgi:hypothetical protein
MAFESVLQHKDQSALSEQEVARFAPVVFNDTAHDTCSNSYIPVRSWDIVEELRTHGYAPTQVQIKHRRGYMQHTAHTIRFSQVGRASRLIVVGDVAPQLVMRNSLDGSHKLEFWNGLMRLACLNGLIVSDASIAQPLAVRHLANPTLLALMAIQEIADQSVALFEHIDAMRKTKMTERQQLRMASGALGIMNVRGIIQPAELLVPRRPDDAGTDVWRTFNRVQENVVRGGITGKTADNRATKTRGLTGIAAQLDANKALWSLAMDAIGRASDSSKAAVRALNAAHATA